MQTVKIESTGRVAKRDVYLFGVLTVLLSFATYLLPLPRTLLPFLIVLLPALLAVILTAARGGKEGVCALWDSARRWRVGGKWLAIALLMALFMRVTMSVVALWLGIIPAIQMRPASPVELLLLAAILFCAALFEELGWRGYALPKLLAIHNALVASLIISVMWGLVHLVLLLPGMMHEGVSPLATMLSLIGMTVLLTWLYINSGGSVLLVTLFHASQSFFVIVNEGISLAQQVWLMTGVGLLMAFVVVIVSGPRLRARQLRSTVHPVTS